LDGLLPALLIKFQQIWLLGDILAFLCMVTIIWLDWRLLQEDDFLFVDGFFDLFLRWWLLADLWWNE
jgi:hypothetical protein